MIDTANSNQLWADLFVEELIRCGVTCFCIAPGSRSTPLVAAIARNPAAASVVHFDERGTSFFALGYGRATGRAAAWVTTSGTAVANGFPAIVEAATDNVPLLLLTADRPPELRQTGANQTIDQPQLFGSYVRWQFDVPAPDDSLDPTFLLTLIDQAVYRAQRPPRGPVHLNCMFREPLVPELDAPTDFDHLKRLTHWIHSNQPFTRYIPHTLNIQGEGLETIRFLLTGASKGLVVAGRLSTWEEGLAVQRLARELKWPLLADVLSQVRFGETTQVNRVDYYDLILSSIENPGDALAPDTVLVFGSWPTSKRLGQYLDRVSPERLIYVGGQSGRIDPNHQVTHRVEADIVSLCESMTISGSDSENGTVKDLSWLRNWVSRSEQIEQELARHFTEADRLTEPGIAFWFTNVIPDGCVLFLANSMPVRDVDVFAGPRPTPLPVGANRGASGIDGTIASAAGFAAGHDAACVLLMGDLSFLHDLNSLALLRNLKKPFVIVLVNNDGGGIFHFLPIAARTSYFEKYFGTPHGLTFKSAAGLFGLEYVQPDSVFSFLSALKDACERPTPTLIEIRSDRVENVEVHREIVRRIKEIRE